MSAAASALSRMSMAVASVLSVPLLLGYLGTERYGVWLTIATAATWLVVAQLGLGPSLLNVLAGARGRDDGALRPRAVSTAWWLQVVLALAVLLALAVALLLIPWQTINADGDPGRLSDVVAAIAIVWLGAALAMPGSIVSAVFRADQTGYVASAWDTGIGPIRLLAVVAAIGLDAGLPGVAAAWALAPLLLVVGASIQLLVFREASLRPKRSLFDRDLARRLLNTGGSFTGIAAVALIISSTDVLIIAALLGPASVPAYAVPMMVVQLFVALELSVLDGIWPAYSEAAARGDVGWVRAAHRRLTVALVAAGVAFAVGFLLFGTSLIRIWSGPSLTVDPTLLAVFAVLVIVQAAQLPSGRLLTALGHVRTNMALGLLNGAVNITVSIVLAGIVGVIGVAVGTVMGYVVLAVPLFYSARRALATVEPFPSPSATGAVILAEEMA